ncbi:MAG TPA: hypothetical protein VFZ18_05875, partial [Longimicrobiaceae bacterium]
PARPPPSLRRPSTIPESGKQTIRAADGAVLESISHLRLRFGRGRAAARADGSGQAAHPGPMLGAADAQRRPRAAIDSSVIVWAVE